MNSLFGKVGNAARTLRPGALAFGLVALLTVSVTVGFRVMPMPQPPIAPPPPPLVVEPVTPPIGPATRAGKVTVRGNISQTKVAQHGNGEVFYDLTIDTPAEIEAVSQRRPTDMILILDRSGSMSDDRKLEYAKAAIRQLIDQLGSEDRFALVDFDDTAQVDIGLTPMSSSLRDRARGIVNEIQPGASTCISCGFSTAQSLIREKDPRRAVRVLLLSDGEANQGISDISGLSNIVKGFVRQGAVVSTIGMGLGFNQALLSSLADHGMGNYSYLESLQNLVQILDKDLKDSRRLYAATSELLIRLGDGVTLQDAGGYPIEANPGRPGEFRILTGQLLSGAHKSFMLTLNVPTDRRRVIEVGRLGFTYNRNGSVLSGQVPPEAARIAVVESDREAIASIKQDVYKKGWLANNLGKAKAIFGSALSSGNRVEAQKAVDSYQAALRKAEARTGIMMAPAAKAAADEMGSALTQSFTGNAAMDAVNQNRFAKQQHAGARTLQRGN